MWRRLRAIFAFAVLWAAAWGLVGFGLGLITWLRFAAGRHPAYGRLMWGVLSAIPYAMLGALCGGGFAALVSWGEREGTVGDLSLRRASLWGGLGGALAVCAFGGTRDLLTASPLHLAGLLFNAAVFGTVGALSAATSLGAARSARLEAPGEVP